MGTQRKKINDQVKGNQGSVSVCHVMGIQIDFAQGVAAL